MMRKIETGLMNMDSVSGSFSGYLGKTKNTQKISDWVSRNAKSKIDALQQTTTIAYKYNAYKSDLEAYGVLEKFAEPDETLEKGVGDCDCKSGLIVSVLDGLPTNLKPDEYRVTIGKFLGNFPLNPNEYHAWSEAKTGNDWYILDGTSGKVLKKPDLRYVSMFNIYPDKITMNNPTIDIITAIPIIPLMSLHTAVEKIIRGE